MDRKDPRWEQHARHSPVLQSMLADPATPLNRDTFIALNWMGEPPQPWTAEHELELPEPFRRPLPREA